MLFERIEAKGLAHYSYLIGAGNRAVVIDPRRDCDVYIEAATREGRPITHILETHRNEDYVIGSVELAHRTGAEVLHSAYGGLLAEHIVGQELVAFDMNSPAKINFWVKEKKQSNAEVDFILPYNQYAIPMEVKAGKSGTLRSLHEFIELAKPPYGIRLYAGPIQETKTKTPKGTPYKLLSLPYFLTPKIYEYITWMKW